MKELGMELEERWIDKGTIVKNSGETLEGLVDYSLKAHRDHDREGVMEMKNIDQDVGLSP